jgi:beta-galactosidase
VVAWDQLELPFQAPPAAKADTASMPSLKLAESGLGFVVSGEGFELTIGRTSGAIESLKAGGKELIARPLQPNFWRVPTDNDVGNGMPKRQGVWWQAGQQRVLRSLKGERAGEKAARVTAEFVLPAGGAAYKNVYTVYGSGDIVVECDLRPETPLPDLPRLGMQMAMPGEFRTLVWFGRGPQETYWDRRTGATVGLYSGPADEQIHVYTRPQETGNKTDVRWMSLTNAGGVGLMAAGIPLIHASVWPFPQETLETAKHTHELVRGPDLTVNIDYRQMGVGGDDSWGARPHPQYTLPSQPYHYKFRLRVLRGGEDPAKLSRMTFE